MLKRTLLVQLRNRLQILDQRQTSALRKTTGVLPALVYVIHCTVKHPEFELLSLALLSAMSALHVVHTCDVSGHMTKFEAFEVNDLLSCI